MKMKKKTAMLLAILTVCLCMTVFAFAADSTYDSAKDPIVAKSYLDDQIATVKSAYEKEIAALKAEIENLKKNGTGSGSSSGSTGTTTANTAFTVLQLKKGQTIYAKGGSIEMILRRGSAVVVSPFNDEYTKQGISDVTLGRELFNGEKIAQNCMLLIPQGDDGRGMKITSDDGAWVMVRGNYEVK